MTLEELATVLVETSFPVAYLAFDADDPPPMPFIVYQETGSNNFGADNTVWHSASKIQIDLLCKKKNRFAEQALENVLTDAHMFWERESSYDDDEECYRMTYYIEI